MDRPSTPWAISNGVMRFFAAVVAVLAVATVGGHGDRLHGEAPERLPEIEDVHVH